MRPWPWRCVNTMSAIEVREAATVVCLRRRPDGASRRRTELRLRDYDFQKSWTEFGDVFSPRAADDDSTGQGGTADNGLGGTNIRGHGVRPQGGVIEFASDWQVLMGQAEVVNWIRTPSATDPPSLMRYPGEYKFAGGGVDGSETLLGAARRELEEEFRTAVPESASLFLFNVTQTKPVQGRSYSMYNFVCMAEENPWLADLDSDAINISLAECRSGFENLRASGEFFALDKEGREAVAPEVQKVEWLESNFHNHSASTAQLPALVLRNCSWLQWSTQSTWR